MTLGTLKPHGATVIKVERMEDKPIIIASDGHYSMGAECRELTIENGSLKIIGPDILPVETNYTVWLLEPWKEKGTNTAEVKIPAGNPTVILPLE